MFKIAKLEKIKKEQININVVSLTICSYKNEKKNSEEEFKTLSFNIYNDNYSFSFQLNCPLEKLLEIKVNETIDFKNYILDQETILIINKLAITDPDINISITQYLKNKFIVYLTFNTKESYDNDTYSGIIEFEFNLENYL